MATSAFMLAILTANTVNGDTTCALQVGMCSLYGHQQMTSFSCMTQRSQPVLINNAEIQTPTPTLHLLIRWTLAFPCGECWISYLDHYIDYRWSLHHVSRHQSHVLKPVKRWHFRKANWQTFKQMTDVATSQLPPPDTADPEDVHRALCRILTKSAKHSIPCGYNNTYIPCWDDECEEIYKEHISTQRTFLVCIYCNITTKCFIW